VIQGSLYKYSNCHWDYSGRHFATNYLLLAAYFHPENHVWFLVQNESASIDIQEKPNSEKQCCQLLVEWLGFLARCMIISKIFLFI